MTTTTTSATFTNEQIHEALRTALEHALTNRRIMLAAHEARKQTGKLGVDEHSPTTENAPLSIDEYNLWVKTQAKGTVPTYRDIMNHSGWFGAALMECGLNRSRGPSGTGREELLASLRAGVAALGEPMSIADYDAYAQTHNLHRYARIRHGLGSWENGAREAGFTPARLKRITTDESLAATVRNLCLQENTLLTVSEYDDARRNIKESDPVFYARTPSAARLADHAPGGWVEILISSFDGEQPPAITEARQKSLLVGVKVAVKKLEAGKTSNSKGRFQAAPLTLAHARKLEKKIRQLPIRQLPVAS